MGFVKLACPNCGAAIELSEDREYGFCTYCGTKVMQDKVVIEHRGKVSVSGVADIQAILDRATLFLEDRQFDKALQYCERVLDIDPRNPDAYIAKLMSQTQCSRVEDLSKCEKPLDRYISYKRAMRFASDDKKETLFSCLKQSISNYNESLNRRNAELGEVKKKLTYYSQKSESANFWVEHYSLLRGISIIIIVIILLGMIIGSKVSTPRFIFLISASILFAVTIIKKNRAEEIDEQYKNYRIYASEAIKEYEDWAKWVEREEF